MYITKINLENYRNYNKQEIIVDQGINIFIGDNAQGKTNILESIYLASIGKSFRAKYDDEMIKMEQDYFDINIDYVKADKEDNIDIRLLKGKHKQVCINGIKLEKLSQVVGNIKVVLFSPDELQIIKDSPSARRKFFDISISQLKPIYLYNILQYNKILAQRNSLIKQIKDNKNLRDTIDVWNEKLAKTGIEIVNNRMQFVEKINKRLREKHEMISDSKEILTLKYVPDCETEEEFIKKLNKNLDSDIFRGYTSNGPQKDNYIFYLNDLELSKYGSQGQQRSSVLSYKLAEMDNIYEEFLEKPILLLDDVTSELDQSRTTKLLEVLKDYQTFITCTDVHNFKTLTKYKLYKVVKGEVEEV